MSGDLLLLPVAVIEDAYKRLRIRSLDAIKNSIEDVGRTRAKLSTSTPNPLDESRDKELLLLLSSQSLLIPWARHTSRSLCIAFLRVGGEQRNISTGNRPRRRMNVGSALLRREPCA